MTSTIVFIAVGLLLYFLNNASKAPVVALEEGKYNLRMSKAYQLVGLLGIAVSVTVLAMPIIANEYSPEIFVVTGGLFIAIAAASAACFLWYKNHRLYFDETVLSSRDWLGKEQSISWDNVRDVRSNPFLGMVEVLDRNDNIVKAHQHLVGFSTLMKELQLQKKKHGFEIK